MSAPELSRADQASLSWFFSTGAAAFERSTLGPMLDHAELYGCGSYRCQRCMGTGVTLPTGAWCSKCNGTGAMPVDIDRSVRSVDELPVNETASASGGYTPDDSTLVKYAVVSRRLLELAPAHRDALQAYYGDAGNRAENSQAWRMVAVYPLVSAGKRLIRLALDHQVDQTRTDFGPHELAVREVEAQQTNRLPQRAALIDAAEEQATTLLLAAVVAWNAQRGRSDAA